MAPGMRGGLEGGRVSVSVPSPPYPHEVLAVLKRLSGPDLRTVTIAEVAAELGAPRGKVWRVLNRLRRQGLVAVRTQEDPRHRGPYPLRYILTRKSVGGDHSEGDSSKV